MPSRPTILLALSLPAGVLGYAVGVRVISALPLPASAQEVLTMFAPLFVAGLFMLPFLIPFFDRMAKRDLAAHDRDRGPVPDDVADPPAARRP